MKDERKTKQELIAELAGSRARVTELEEALQGSEDRLITVFDPTTIIGRATHLNSAQYSEVVHYVLVNGTVVLDAGEFVTGAAPGRPIRRPSRED
jgi:hypothetical protein